MKVFVNAPSVKEGGSRVVVTKLIPAMRTLRPDIDWIVAAPPSIIAQLGEDRIVAFPMELRENPFQLLKWYESTLPSALNKLKADVLFSVTNYLPWRRVNHPVLLLEQHAGHFSSDFDRLTIEHASSWIARMGWSFKRSWVRASVRSATVLTVQTQALADAIRFQTGRPRDRIRVIAHGTGLVETASALPVRERTTVTRIGYVTKWGVQKNFETLFRAVKILKESGFPLRLVLTLDRFNAPVEKTLALTRELGIGELVENHGDIGASQIGAIYDGLDIFVFPSICESFGMTMVEAMARGLPMIVASTPENLEITEKAGLDFPSTDADALAARLAALITDPQAMRMQAALSLTRAHDFSWKKAATQTIDALEQAIRVYGH